MTNHPPVLALFNLGGMEVVLLVFVVLLLFGAKRLPELAKGLGKSVKEFKKAASEAEEEIHSALETGPAKPPAEKKPSEPSAKTNLINSKIDLLFIKI